MTDSRLLDRLAQFAEIASDLKPSRPSKPAMVKLSILHLTLHRRWFADIASGEKKIEYRERKPYWKTRLQGRRYDIIKFRNGYSKNAPEIMVEFRGVRKAPKKYEILLGRILSLKRWPPKR
jgi:hypothetical protein